MHRTVRLLALPLLAGVLVATGCTTSGNDAGVKDRAHGKRPVYDMPDGYPNISAVCVRGTLILASSEKGTPPVVVIGNTTCQGRDGEPPSFNR